MSLEMEEVAEGRTRLLVPVERVSKGPGTRAAAFFNEGMRLNRDMAVAVVDALPKRDEGPLRVLDGLSATGALGVRLANEVEGLEVTLNDRNPVAHEVIERNIALNGLDPSRARAEMRDLNALVRERRYDCIDVDPFGTPVPFLDGAFNALYRKGFVGVTATDKAPLCGAHAKACIRRYMSTPLRAPFSDEVGLRILVGYCARTAAKYDIGIKPLVSYSYSHHFRVYLGTEQGAGKADGTLENIGYLRYSRTTGERCISDRPGEGDATAGPLWTGPLIDGPFLSRMRPRSYMAAAVHKLLGHLSDEVGAPALFYTIDEMAERLITSPVPMDSILGRLSAQGRFASRTHFSPTGFKTDAPIGEIESLFRT